VNCNPLAWGMTSIPEDYVELTHPEQLRL